MQEFDRQSVYDLDTFRQGKYEVNDVDVYSSPFHKINMWTVLQNNTLAPPASRSERLMIVMGGTGEYRSADVLQSVEDGSMMVVQPGERHEIRNIGNDPLVVLTIDGQEKK